MRRMYLDVFYPNRFGINKDFLDLEGDFKYSLGYSTKGMQQAYSMEFDRNGIIMMSHYVDDLNSGEHYYSPVKIAHYALAAYNDYKETGDDSYLGIFNAHVGFLKDNYSFHNENPDLVVWTTPSSNPKYLIPYDYKSSIVQGLVISALVRSYLLSNDRTALDLATKAVNILTIPVEKDGLLANSKWGAMYEEYPCIPYSHVVNGFMFCLIGLFDLKTVKTNDLVEALFKNGISSLENVVADWITPVWSKYDLWDLTNNKSINLSTRHYHYLHIDQLDILFQMSGKVTLLKTRDKLINQMRTPFSFFRIYTNKFVKLILKK